MSDSKRVPHEIKTNRQEGETEMLTPSPSMIRGSHLAGKGKIKIGTDTETGVEEGTVTVTERGIADSHQRHPPKRAYRGPVNQGVMATMRGRETGMRERAISETRGQ